MKRLSTAVAIAIIFAAQSFAAPANAPSVEVSISRLISQIDDPHYNVRFYAVNTLSFDEQLPATLVIDGILQRLDDSAAHTLSEQGAINGLTILSRRGHSPWSGEQIARAKQRLGQIQKRVLSYGELYSVNELRDVLAHVKTEALHDVVKSSHAPTPHADNVDPGLFSIVEKLRQQKVALSWLSAAFNENHISGRLVAAPLPKPQTFEAGSAVQVAFATHTAIEVDGPRTTLEKIEQLGKNFGVAAFKQSDTAIIVYPALLSDPSDREISLLVSLYEQSSNVAAFNASANFRLRETMSQVAQLQDQSISAANKLASLDSQAAELEEQLKQELLRTQVLQNSLNDWGQKIGEISTLSTFGVGGVTKKYDPNGDLGLPVVRTDPHFVDIHGRGIPIHDWDPKTQSGVSAPYLDAGFADQLGKFFKEQGATLKAAGMGGLQVEGAVRTPEYQQALTNAGNPLSVGQYNSNHLIGESCDFSGVDLNNPKTFGALKNMLKPYGIELGTTSHGKPDNIHATPSKFAAANSPERLARTAQMVGRYAEHYERLYAEGKAKASAANDLKSRELDALKTMEQMVAGAADKCSKLDAQIKAAKAQNASLQQQIDQCVKTYGALKALRDKSHGTAKSPSGHEIMDKIARGEDVRADAEKAYNDAIRSCMDRYGNARSEETRDANGNLTGFKVECGGDDRGNDKDNDGDGNVVGSRPI